MTIAISVKVNDGVVLASDSAATVLGSGSSGTAGVVNVYENACKIFNLRKGCPIGAVTWGAGSIGVASVSTLAKDFRDSLSHGKEAIDPGDYKIEGVAKKLKKFMFDQHYEKAFAKSQQKPLLGFIVAGYSSDGNLGEEWQVVVQDGQCPGPTRVRKKEEIGIAWQGAAVPVQRLVLGFDPRLANVLKEAQVEDAQVGRIMDVCRQRLSMQLALPPMPIQDAILLAEFLVETAIRFSRFAPGAQTVGGPIEVAAITKHEGFRWIRRKHYFDRQLNERWEGAP